MSDLKLFRVGAPDGAAELPGRSALVEKQLQALIEGQMQALMGVRFLASLESTGHPIPHHFRGVTKMIELGQVGDLSRALAGPSSFDGHLMGCRAGLRAGGQSGPKQAPWLASSSFDGHLIGRPTP